MADTKWVDGTSVIGEGGGPLEDPVDVFQGQCFNFEMYS